MRLAAAVLFVTFLCAECKPSINLHRTKLGKEVDDIPVEKEVVGTNNVEVREDGTIDVDNVKTSETKSSSSNTEQSSYRDGYYNENADGSSSSGSETHEMAKQSEASQNHKETTHEGMRVGPNGLTKYDQKQTADESMTRDSEYHKDTYENSKNGQDSSSQSRAEYESQKERSTHVKKTNTEENEYNLGLDGTKVKKNKESTDEHEDETKESGRFQEEKEDYERRNGQTTHTQSNSGGGYESSSANKTTKKNKEADEQTQNQHKSGLTKNGLQFPDEFYSYLNRDSKKLGLSGAYRHSSGNLTNSRYDDIRQDYLLTVARKLYSKSRRVDSDNSTSTLQTLKSDRISPVPSHYYNIKFVEDKFSKLPMHYYTAVKYGIMDPDVKKAIFSHDLRNLRKIQHTPRNVNNIFKSIGYNRYREKDTTGHKKNLNEITINGDVGAVSDSNKNKEVISRGEENTETNKYSRYNNAGDTLNAEDSNKISTVGSNDFVSSGSKSVNISVKAHDDRNFTDNISEIDSGSYVASHNDGNADNTFSNLSENSKTESTGSHEFYNTTMSEDDAVSASYIQALPETKNVNTSNIDKADSIDVAIVSADSYDDELDTNNENMSNITELNPYSNDGKTSDVNSTDTLDLSDVSTNYFDILSIPTVVSADSVTESYDDLTNATITIDNGDSESYDSDKFVTSTSLYPTPNSVDGIATDLPSASSNVMSDKNTSDSSLQESNTWSYTLKPYIDSNIVDGTANDNFDSNLNTSIATTTYSDTNSSDENFISGNKVIDAENNVDILSESTAIDSYENKNKNNDSNTSIASATMTPKINSADNLASDNTAISIDEFNNSTDATDINGFNSNLMDSDLPVDTSTTYLLTNSVNNFDKSGITTTDYLNSNTNHSNSSFVTAMTSSVTNSADAFASDDMAIELAGEFSNSNATVATNDTNSNFDDDAATLNATTPSYLDTNSENRFTSDDWMFPESAVSNLTDASVTLTTTDMTLLVSNSTDASSPVNTSINLASDLKNISESTANDDSGSNFSDTTVLTTTIYPMNKSADNFASDNMTKDIANESSNLSESMAINFSETKYSSEIILSTEPSFSTANSSDSVDTDSIATDIAEEYNNSSDSVAINSSDSNLNESVPTATTYSMSNGTDNFISNNLTTDINISKNSSDTMITDSFYNTTNNSDISITTEITSSIVSNADDYAFDNITTKAENVNTMADGVVSNSNVSDTSIATETISLMANSSDDYNSNMVIGIANVHDNSSETILPDLLYSYFDSTPNDNITTDTEPLNLNSSLIDSNMSTTERTAIKSSNDSSNTETSTDSNLSTTTATESNISNTGDSLTTNSSTVINTDVSSDPKDKPESERSTNLDSNLALSSPSDSITSDSGGNIDKSGSSIISNNSLTTIPNNVPTAGVAKKLNVDNTSGQNRAAGDQNNTGKPVSVKPKNDKFVFTEETESKSDEDASINIGTSSEQPIFTSIDSSRIESGSMSIETP